MSLKSNKKVITKKNISSDSEDKILLDVYTNEKKLKDVCKSFENQKIEMIASFMEKKIVLKNCNAFGDILEDIFFPLIKEKIPDFEKGPKQASPDYYGDKKNILNLNKKHSKFIQALILEILRVMFHNYVKQMDYLENYWVPNI